MTRRCAPKTRLVRQGRVYVRQGDEHVRQGRGHVCQGRGDVRRKTRRCAPKTRPRYRRMRQGPAMRAEDDAVCAPRTRKRNGYLGWGVGTSSAIDWTRLQ